MFAENIYEQLKFHNRSKNYMSISCIRLYTHQRTNIIHKNVWRLLLLLNLVLRMDRWIEKLIRLMSHSVASTFIILQYYVVLVPTRYSGTAWGGVA